MNRRILIGQLIALPAAPSGVVGQQSDSRVSSGALSANPAQATRLLSNAWG